MLIRELASDEVPLLKECMERAAQSIGWPEKRQAPKSGTLRRGVGLAVGTHVSNSAPFCVDYDCVYLRLESDGSLHVATGVPDIGQGSVTALAQVAFREVGIVGVPMLIIAIIDLIFQRRTFKTDLKMTKQEYADYVALGSEKACREAGKLAVEGKEYVVQDGDIMHFLFNV